MSQEIIAQPGLTKVECDVILTALEWFGQAIQQPHSPNEKDAPAQALKKEQYMIVSAEIRGKIVRNVERMGKLRLPNVQPGPRNRWPGRV
jgi:hypothetical protein